MAPLAIGTQTAGSTIRPASYCGVYGCKPTHGTISRHGALMLSRALDHVGVFARTLGDTAMILDVLAGYDADDADTRPFAAPSFLETAADDPPLPPQFAFVRTPAWEQAEEQTRAAFEELVARLGVSATVVDLPDAYTAAAADHRTVLGADMAHALGGVVDRGGELSSQTLRDIVAEGRALPAVRYLAARDAARRYALGIARIFERYDAILTLATTGVAPKGEATGSPMFCTLWTLTGLPALSLPLMTGEGGMPLGVQLVGPAGDDARLLRTANWLINKLAS